MLPSIWKNRGMSPTLDDFVEKFFYGWPKYNEEVGTSWAPRTDVREREKDFLIDVELPGIEKKDIKVEVKNDVLTISGERNDEHEVSEKGYRNVERHYGKFERSFTLPDTVKAENITAAYKNGVMTLTLPKTEKALPKEITVDVK